MFVVGYVKRHFKRVMVMRVIYFRTKFHFCSYDVGVVSAINWIARYKFHSVAMLFSTLTDMQCTYSVTL
jgi:hypothetical protein